MEDKNISHEESLKIIQEMIGKAKDNMHETGFNAILWGAVISFCSLFTYFQMIDVLPKNINVWWLIVLAIGSQVFYATVLDKRPQTVITYEETALNWIWSVFGIGIAIIVFSQYMFASQVSELRTILKSVEHKPVDLFQSFNVFWLLWYGFPGIITGGITKFKVMLYGSIVCWVGAVVSIFVPNEIDMLLMALGAITSWLIPGLILRNKFNRLKRKMDHV